MRHFFQSLLLFALVPVLLALGACQPTSAAELLRWKLKTGDQLKVTQLISADQSVAMNAGGGETGELKVYAEALWDVKEAKAGQYKIDCKFTRVAIKGAEMGENIKYDSASTDEVTGKALEAKARIEPLLKESFEIAMDELGNVTTSEAQAPPTSQGRVIAQLFKAICGPLFVAPKEQAESGATWEAEQVHKDENIPTLTFTSQFQLESVGATPAKLAKVSEKIEMAMGEGENKLPIPGLNDSAENVFSITDGILQSRMRTLRTALPPALDPTGKAGKVAMTQKTTVERIGKSAKGPKKSAK